MIKIIAWNIQAGGGSRILSIVKNVVKSKSAIVIFNEFRNNDSGITLRNYLLKAGYRYQAVTAAQKNENSVLICSTLAFDSKIFDDADPVFTNNILLCKFKAFNVLGVYLPHKKKHALLEFITNLVKKSEVPYIIGGDFNTGKNYIDQKGKSFWYTDQLVALEKTGYFDAFRLVNGEVEEYSWFSHQGNGFRYDHFYIDEHLKSIVKNCYYDQSWREEKLSDHSPMFLELG
ncbi:MAG: endonuclease/exonuclease/phosphatase family protein [Saprospiraceae bacterium]